MLVKSLPGARVAGLIHSLPLRSKAAELSTRHLSTAALRIQNRRNRLSPLTFLSPSASQATRYLADRAVSRPKAHTGRSSKTKRIRDPARQGTGKPLSSKTRVRVKAKASAKAKAKKPKKPKKVPTPEEKRKAQVLKWKRDALSTPKRLPESAWGVLLTEHARSEKVFGRGVATAAANQYRNLSASEREHYNHIANENKSQNDDAYKRFIKSQSPAAIRTANLARARLRKLDDRPKRSQQLTDERQPKRPRSSFLLFSTDRNASGDFAGVKLADRGPLIGQEWKNLTASQRQPFIDAAARDKERYLAECKKVYGS